MRIEVIVDVKTTLGEGPLWDDEQERLYWIDSFDGRMFRATTAGNEIRCWDVPQKSARWRCARMAPAKSFRWRAAFNSWISRAGDVDLIVDPEPNKTNNRLNDGKVDKRGRFLAGSMDTMEEGHGALYRLDSDFPSTSSTTKSSSQTVLAGVTMDQSSILPTPGPGKSGRTITTSRPALFPIGGPL